MAWFCSYIEICLWNWWCNLDLISYDLLSSEYWIHITTFSVHGFLLFSSIVYFSWSTDFNAISDLETHICTIFPFVFQIQYLESSVWGSESTTGRLQTISPPLPRFPTSSNPSTSDESSSMMLIRKYYPRSPIPTSNLSLGLGTSPF